MRRTPLGRLLQERREALGLSRTRTSDLTGIKCGTIEGWELGRVAKPPLDDVLRLTRFLGVSPDELAATVLDRDDSTPGGGSIHAGIRPAGTPGAVPLLEHAIELFGWSETQTAGALQTTPTTLRAWRAGSLAMSLPEVMTVAALIGLHAAGAVAADVHTAELANVLGRVSEPDPTEPAWTTGLSTQLARERRSASPSASTP